ncbi:predicted protein [Uncinocarpus reesii 1704]|uniref:Uncharacterized protein n=1 Tax=Uncinocarpus reesii (strain UAMH 1704) TaxID=336963 RepID=C4JI30_UNCRE|nr:uncharacterized protein UREG_01455 [Uncinocarpus reesii 1704]EEP76606.1 predicted protein [Uncinocarpus reesii 1704]
MSLLFPRPDTHRDQAKTGCSDLESEIAEIEAEEAGHGIKFLREIEKELMAIPKSVLNHRPDNELVLYAIPRSLSMPEEEDIVRPIMADARERAREKSLVDTNGEAQAGQAPSAGSGDKGDDAKLPGTSPIGEPEDIPYADDVDAMDIDG